MLKIISALFLAIASASAFIPTAAIAQTVHKNKPIEIADNAPNSYTVMRGDTLWRISGKFLKQPWRWPEVWQMNKTQIRNPHWIYPGQTIYLDRNGPKLTLGGFGSGQDGKLEPEIRSSSNQEAIPSIPLSEIQQFLDQPFFSDASDSAKLPTIVALPEKRVLASVGDTIYAKGINEKQDLWQIYRRAKPIKDPITHEILGYESVYVGKAEVISVGHADTASKLKVTVSRQDINIGDRLQPVYRDDVVNFVPHPIPASLTGNVAGMYDGVEDEGVGGRYNVISINKGAADGMELGHVVALYRKNADATYLGDGKKEIFKLPEERYGLAFVFRVFNRVSYALIVNSNQPVSTGDEVRAP